MSKTCEVCEQKIKAFGEYKINQKTVCGMCADKYYAQNGNPPVEYSSTSIKVVDKRVATSNRVASLLFAIGITLMAFGFVTGIAAGSEYSYEFSWTLSLAVWFGAFVSGMIFIGFSEVIKLLHAIANRE